MREYIWGCTWNKHGHRFYSTSCEYGEYTKSPNYKICPYCKKDIKYKGE